MATIFDYEGVVSRVDRRASGRGWTRRATFYPIPNSLVSSLLPAEWAPYPGESGKHAAVLVDSSISDAFPRTTAADGMVSRVTLYYRQRTAEEWLVANPNNFLLIRSNAGYSSGAASQKFVVASATETITDSNTAHSYTGRPIFRVYGYTNNLAVYVTPFLGNAYATNLTDMNSFGLDEFGNKWGQVGRQILLNLTARPSLAGASLYQVNYIFTTRFLPTGVISHSVRQLKPLDVGTTGKKRTVQVFSGTSSSDTGGYGWMRDFSVINNAITEW